MSVSFETLILARKYTDNKAMDIGEEILEQAVTEAVAESKIYTDHEISKVLSFDIEVVSTLPSDPNKHTIYLVPKSLLSENNGYYEYIYVDNKWELLGDTEIDLSGYYTKDEVDQIIEINRYILPAATTSSLGGIKIDDTSVNINNDGILSVNESNTERVINETIQPIEEEDIAELFD